MLTHNFLQVLLTFLLLPYSAFGGVISNELSRAYSPPFYPTPQAQGYTENWKNAIAKAKEFLQDASIEQMSNITTGMGLLNGPCAGNIAAQEDINFPGLCLIDGPLGISAPFVSSFPAGISTASTFDRKLIRERGVAIGSEAKGYGANILFGPMMNLHRVAAGGRNWEGFGSDPYLSGEASYESVMGIQSQNVQTCAKHFINNEQEHFRNHYSSNVDDRAQHELYLAPFIKSVQAEMTSVMCSINAVNNSFGCQNSYLLNGLLKTELAYDGFVVTDWTAHRSGHNSANAGLDMSMPGEANLDNILPNGTYWFGPNLVESVKNGSVEESRLRDMATRIVAAWYLVGQDVPSYPERKFDRNTMTPENGVRVQGDHAKLIRKIGAASIVLLKNENEALPLDKPNSISLIGNGAGPSFAGPNYSGSGGPDASLANGRPSTGFTAQGWGSGVSEFSYLIDPLHAFQDRCTEDGTMINWWLDNFDVENAARIAQSSSAAIVFVGASAGEELYDIDENYGDRNNLSAWWDGDELVKAVASANNNTVVIVNSVGPVTMEAWVENPNVTAVVWAGLIGQEAGRSLTDVLYGDVNPSGRLPFTFAKERKDYGVDVIYQNSSQLVQVPYDESLLIDYRYFDAKNIEPRYEFGHGLSYTKFEYSNIQVANNNDSANSESKPVEAYGKSVRPEIHQKLYQITVNIKNVGNIFGHEVPQLYLGFPKKLQEPPKVLKGFERIGLESGESKKVIFDLTPYDVSFWDTNAQDWVNALQTGTIKLMIGASSRDIRIEGMLSNN